MFRSFSLLSLAFAALLSSAGCGSPSVKWTCICKLTCSADSTQNRSDTETGCGTQADAQKVIDTVTPLCAAKIPGSCGAGSACACECTPDPNSSC
jgi:hypothetical protein